MDNKGGAVYNLAEQFGGGATVKWLYSAYPSGGTFGLSADPEQETRAIKDWLQDQGSE